MSKLKQTVMSSSERDRHRGALVEIGAFRNHPSSARRHGSQLCVRAVEANGHDLLPDFQIIDVLADFDDLARSLIADDVRFRYQRTAETIERVATFNTYGFDANDDTVRLAFGIRHVLVAQHARGTVLVIDSSFHGMLFVTEWLEAPRVK